jgi:hypothetical protein
MVISPELSIKDVDNSPVVEMSWDDYIEMSKFFEDLKRYLLEQKVLICEYRKDLNEDYCK